MPGKEGAKPVRYRRSVVGMEAVAVRITTDGIPLSFKTAGRTWHVAADPVRWYERINWWEGSPRMPRGGDRRIDTEIWQLQARLGRNTRSPLVTFVLARNQETGEWTLRSKSAVTD